MFEWGSDTDNFNPQILFAVYCTLDGKKELKEYKYHCHDFLELSIPISGEVNYIIDDKKYMLKKGEVFICNPGVYHQEIVNQNSKWSQLYIGIANVKVSNICKNFIDYKDKGPILSLEKYDIEIRKCCDEIIKEEKLKKLGYPVVLKSLIIKLLIMICREIEGNDNYEESTYQCSFQTTEKKKIVNEIIEYMNMYYMEDISLDKISKNMYISPVYISKIFKEETGESPINHLIKIRLSKAEDLLKQNNMTIKAVAESVGYKDAYHFSKIFKKYYGITPSQIVRCK